MFDFDENLIDEFDEEMPDGNADEGSMVVADEQESLFSGLPEEVRKALTPAHMRAVNYYLTGNYNYKQIGAIIGVSAQTISAWLMKPEIQYVIKELQARELQLAQASLYSLRNLAIDTMKDLLDSNMDNVRFQAAKDILDRGGLKASQNIKVDKTVTTLEQQMANLVEYTISEDDVIDIDLDDILSEVKSPGN